MNISNTLIATSIFLTNFLPKFLISDHHRRLVLLHENQTQTLTDITLKIVSTDTSYKSSWYIRNVDETISHEHSCIPHQGIFLIILIKSITNASQWIINLNKTIPFHPRCHTLIISENKPQTNSQLTNAVNSLWNISIINVGILFLSNEINEIFTYNPYPTSENGLINVFSSSDSNVTVPDHIHNYVFFEKLTNLNGAHFPVMIGLDWGKVYKKTNSKMIARNVSYNLGGSEVYTMNIIGKRINANVIYNLQLFTLQPNSTDLELSEYLDTINRPVYLPYDQSEPIKIIPKIFGQKENE